jgi:LPS-assembly protein
MRCNHKKIEFVINLRKLSFCLFLAGCVMPVIVQAQSLLVLPHRTTHVDETGLPVFVQADKLSGRPEVEVYLESNVEIERGETKLTTDYAVYNRAMNEALAKGNVWVRRFGNIYRGDELKLNLDSGQGYMTNLSYHFYLTNGQGRASRIDFKNNEQAEILECTYSTCNGANPDWYLKASKLNLDMGEDEGSASDVVVYFKGVPIFASPVVTFPLSDKRRSGVLSPTFGVTSNNGVEFMLPYYVNIAPNRDMTFYPKMIARRGAQLGMEGRYLEEKYSGETRLEMLPGDRLSKTNRYFVDSRHTQSITREFGYTWNIKRASDDNYLRDFSNSIADSSQRLLARNVDFYYRGTGWDASVKMGSYQLLQDVLAPTIKPYNRLPQVSFRAAKNDIRGFDASFDAEFTRFYLANEDLAGRVRGNRFIARSQLAYPFITPGYFVTPKIAFNAASYQLDSNTVAPLARTSFSRILPTVSVDSGMVFERETTLFGKAAVQTLEPRLFYVYTPYLDQSLYPNFDSAELSFNAAQLFNENRYSGSDRIGDANYVTGALVSRYLTPEGIERLRLSMGQRFYFTLPRKVDNSGLPVTQNRSDFLLAAVGKITPQLTLDSSLQYSFGQSRLLSNNLRMQWQPAPKKVLNAQYHFTRESNVGGNVVPLLREVKFSGQWPLSPRVYGVGRVSYSLPDRKVTDSLIGMEYQQDCWIFRLVGQRFVSASNQRSSAIFVQLELSGLSRLGSNPLEVLRKNIPGYELISNNPKSGG